MNTFKVFINKNNAKHLVQAIPPYQLTPPPTDLVSVALYPNNGGAFIRHQINSICQQNLRPSEIVLSGDASSDDGVALAQSAVANGQGQQPYIQLHVIRNNSPVRVVKNLEQALRACMGNLIALCDHANVRHSNLLERKCSQA